MQSTPPPWGMPPPPPTWPGAWQDRSGLRTGGGLCAAAAVLHLITAPLALWILAAATSAQVGRSVSLGEIFDALNRTGNGFLVTLLIAGAIAQVLFGIVAGVGSYLMYRGSSSFAVPMIVSGIFAIIVSIAILGGIFGIVGGILAIGGGVKGYRPARPAYYAPPPFMPPPTMPR